LHQAKIVPGTLGSFRIKYPEFVYQIGYNGHG
jgi:hypothetical protein